MIEQIYYAVALTVYSIFIIRFILSWVGADFDIDADVDISDVVSFKGLTHFLMGFSGWLSVKSYTTHNVMWYDYLIALILGVIFVILLYFVYKLLISLETISFSCLNSVEVISMPFLDSLLNLSYLPCASSA